MKTFHFDDLTNEFSMLYIEDKKVRATFRAVVFGGNFYDVRMAWIHLDCANARSFCLWRDFYTALQNFCDTGHLNPEDSSNLFE